MSPTIPVPPKPLELPMITLGMKTLLCLCHHGSPIKVRVVVQMPIAVNAEMWLKGTLRQSVENGH